LCITACYTVICKKCLEGHLSIALILWQLQIEVEERCLCLDGEGDTESSNQDADVLSEGQVSAPVGLHQGHCDHSDSTYYTQIYNYLAAHSMPAGATESYKKMLKKRARNYKVSDWLIFYSLANLI
jgi:hypothetical protein